MFVRSFCLLITGIILHSWNHIYFTLERNFEVRDSDVRDSCLGPTDIKTLFYTWGLTRGGAYVRGRRKVVSQWLETLCGTTLFLPVGRKCRLFIVLVLWLASEALLKSTGKKLLQERTTSIAPQCYSFKCNQQDATLSNILYYCQCSTCFRRFLRPSSGAQNCTYSIWYMSSLLVATASVYVYLYTYVYIFIYIRRGCVYY
jgi:hypothetical protein